MSAARSLSQHLTDEQFSDLLAGVSLPHDAEAHLAACSACRAEVEVVAGSLAELNTFSLAWAEREAPRRVPVPSRWSLRLGAHPVWNLGLMTAAAAVALTIGFHLPQHASTAKPATATVAVGGEVPTGAELAEDNRLLSSIDQELSYATQPTVPLAELKSAGHHASVNFHEAVAN